VIRLGATIAVIDRESANGTLLRGARLPANKPVEISPYETFHAGDLAFVVQEATAPTSAVPREAKASGPVDGAPAQNRLRDTKQKPGTDQRTE
jgi:hypothetical protein